MRIFKTFIFNYVLNGSKDKKNSVNDGIFGDYELITRKNDNVKKKSIYIYAMKHFSII